MKKKKIDWDIAIEAFVFIIALISVIFMSLSVNSNQTETEPNMEVTEDTRPYVIEDEVVLTADTELSVVGKQISIHDYTDAELQEQEYFDSLEMLAICVEAEAGNQDLMGKRLVVDVILNRVDSDEFPNDIESVITQPYQFSSYSDGHMDAVYEPSEETFRAVQMELENRTDDKILFFTEGKYNPYCTPAYQHGDHYFGY